MPREYFEKYNPRNKTLGFLNQIKEIVGEYDTAGLILTLRQLYYQLVSRDYIENSEKSYKRTGEIVSKARRGGHLDWDALEDRVRRPQSPSQWDSINDLMGSALASYRLPRLKGQRQYVELWVEKDALAGVLAPIAWDYHITLMVNRGYSSTSAMKDAGERIRQACKQLEVTRAFVLYLGDFDPSGEDMVRDVEERLSDYVNSGWLINFDETGAIHGETDAEWEARMLPPIEVHVEKIGLTMKQVKTYDPPPNPTKLTDSRAKAFIKKHGKSSWEVDALPPKVLRETIEERLDELVDRKRMKSIEKQEEKDKRRLVKALKSLKPKKPPTPRKPRKRKKK